MTTIDFCNVEVAEALKALKTSEEGLSTAEVARRQKLFGPNDLPPAKKRTAFFVFLKQFKSLLIAVLFLAAGLSWITGHHTDCYIILAVVLIDATIGFVMEWKAERAVTALHQLLVPMAKTVRNGQRLTVNASALVPGDILVVEEGDHIPADARIIRAKNLRIIEASLTGESLPVSKHELKQAKATSIADQKNMLWKSTFVASGHAVAVVTAIGTSTAIGRIAQSLRSMPVERSHFQRKIDKLASQMGSASVIAAAILFVVGYFTLHLPFNELFLISIAAMVSIIPEGLQSIIVIVLAIGSTRMTKRNAIVREFSATETLGAVTTIITDKTGTLTENALTAKKIFIYNEPDIEVTGEGWNPIGTLVQDMAPIEAKNHNTLQHALEISAICNNAVIRHTDNEEYQLIGDPTEGALIVLARKGGIVASVGGLTKIDDLPFDSRLKMRSSLIAHHKERQLFVVGAPEIVLQGSSRVRTKEGVISLDDSIRRLLKDKITSWSANAMRVIALASKSTDAKSIIESDLNDLTFTAVIGMIDPPRSEVRSAIAKCRQAGIRVIMATGDHINTAVAISKSVGIIEEESPRKTVALSEDQLTVLDDKEFDEAISNVNVFARLNPETKLRIATRLQAMGQLIAMTGDGVNDAPALKKADVGIAMGVMGTDVARDAAKVVLADDNFATIVNAVEEGRIVFLNARQASFYLITTNFAEISTLIISIGLGLPMPLTAIQILWLNLVTDGIGDIALAAERGHGDALQQKPLQKDERILNKTIWPFLLINVLIMVALSIFSYLYFLPQGIDRARSSVFIVMSFTQLFNLYNMRSMTRSVFAIGFFSNIYVTITVISSALITIAIIELEAFKDIFGFGTIEPLHFLMLALLSAGVLVAGEVYKYLRYQIASSALGC
jgi:Ca2+-transporting ATPase